MKPLIFVLASLAFQCDARCQTTFIENIEVKARVNRAKREVRKITESIVIRPGDVLRNLDIDARSLPKSVPAIVFEGRFQMFDTAKIKNCIVRCNGNVGILMRSSPATGMSFNEIDVTISNASVAMLLDARAGGWVNANRVKLNAFDCGTFVELHSRNGMAMSGNEFNFNFQVKKEGRTRMGIMCNGRGNRFTGIWWDWQKTHAIAVLMGASSRKNIFYTPTPKRTDDLGKNNIFLGN